MRFNAIAWRLTTLLVTGPLPHTISQVRSRPMAAF
jgi:hypothetical protein